MSVPLLALASLGFSMVSEESTDIRTYHIIVEGDLGIEPGYQFEIVTLQHPFIDLDADTDEFWPLILSLERKAILKALEYPVDVLERLPTETAMQDEVPPGSLDIRVGAIVQGGFIQLYDVQLDPFERVWSRAPHRTQEPTAEVVFLDMIDEPSRREIWVVNSKRQSDLLPVEGPPNTSNIDLAKEISRSLQSASYKLWSGDEDIMYIPALIGGVETVTRWGEHEAYRVIAKPGSRTDRPGYRPEFPPVAILGR